MGRSALASEVKVRSYRGGDERGIVATWNAALTYDPIDMNRLVRQVLCDVNFDPEGLKVAVAGDEVVGFALAVRRRVPILGTDIEADKGWITAMGVQPKWQGKGVGGALVDAAEGFLQERGVKEIGISPYAPNYFWPGVDAEAYSHAHQFLERRGYVERYVAAAMDCNLVGFHIPDDVRRVQQEREAEGYTFTPLTPAALYDVIAFAESEFSPDWGRAIREAVAAGLPGEQLLCAHDPQGAVVGFAMFGGYDGILERFGPFGVAGSQRGKGLGKVLLYLTMERMLARGLHGAWFLWTGEKTAAGALYARAGFHVTRRFHVLQKDIAR